MCHSVKVLTKNVNGELAYCENCRKFQLTFNNLYMEFNDEELLNFETYLTNINVDYWDCQYENSTRKRIIPIHTMQKNLSLVFSKQEFDALQELVCLKNKEPQDSLTVLDIDYTLLLN
ncbi:DUF6686 family protein [Gilvibacter sediminis]|uniref:DUF6686 family protein n=1 Tax=Gilvibacter sediminis TaxID=379071 RepID=UPI00300F8550|nr:hypothetical protein [Gilvibacter sediminis]